MSNPPPGKILEGVFAINKPAAISSAQTLRNLQTHFNPSALFAPWLHAERSRRTLESSRQRSRRRDKRPLQVKLGHGGTLDPLATGVLIAGVGKGTKELQGFLECTKSYEAIVLFGVATDSYDRLGKVLKRAPYAHVTRKKVEQALQRFRGKIMQRPPIFSALRVQGKRLYEYAREGKEVPVEIQERPVEVLELEILEWWDGGEHEYTWPTEEAETEEKVVAEQVLHLEEKAEKGEKAEKAEVQSATAAAAAASTSTSTSAQKRPLSETETGEEGVASSSATDTAPPAKRHQAEPSSDTTPLPSQPQQQQQQPPVTASPPPKTNPTQAQPPALRLRLTSTSGFYVRSLCHDLGLAVDSLAIMSELTRTRQGDFELGRNVLEYDDLDKGEEVWGPRVASMLEAWEEGTGKGKAKGKSDGKSRSASPEGLSGAAMGAQKKGPSTPEKRERSSPEKEVLHEEMKTEA
ncbi:MAG: hypothetical protein M1819_005105 [Sarea resinae]|nr:MAG: hypothetical protein M1819_005105 [Sarea resinae]